jgi:hypothetical protein
LRTLAGWGALGLGTVGLLALGLRRWGARRIGQIAVLILLVRASSSNLAVY